MKKFLRYLTIFAAMLSKYYAFTQPTISSKFAFYSEIIPVSILYGGRADGFQTGLGYTFHKKYEIILSYGMNKLTYELSDQVPPGTVNGLPIVDKTTDATLFMPKDWRAGGVPDQSLYELLEEAGIKHYEPRDGAYVTNYSSLEIMRKQSLKNKWDLEWGFGGQLGLMNRNEVGGGLSDSVNYFGVPIKTWIVFRISARYLYYGFTNRITITRKISDHFSVGLSSGIHLVMGKNSTDTFKPYFSIMALCRI